MSEPDGLDEVVETMLRTGLTAAARIGEELARAREQRVRVAQAAEEQQGRELRARLDGERAAARAQLAPALDARWWETANAEDIVRVHQTATAWKSQDPMARSAADAIREQVQLRYGIDVDALGTGADSAGALIEAARAKTQAQAQEERPAAAGENSHAGQLLSEAERADKAQRQNADADNARPEQLTDEAAATYDSAERREALAKSLDHIGDREAVQARLTADRDQATPPTSAVASIRGKAPKARKTRGTPAAAKQAQKGLSR
jgi:colicin import membrane protein